MDEITLTISVQDIREMIRIDDFEKGRKNNRSDLNTVYGILQDFSKLDPDWLVRTQGFRFKKVTKPNETLGSTNVAADLCRSAQEAFLASKDFKFTVNIMDRLLKMFLLLYGKECPSDEIRDMGETLLPLNTDKTLSRLFNSIKTVRDDQAHEARSNMIAKRDATFELLTLMLILCERYESKITEALKRQIRDTIDIPKNILDENSRLIDLHKNEYGMSDKYFFDLPWKESDAKIKKYVGQAGRGKTTQMFNCFRKEAAALAKAKKDQGSPAAIPFWVELKEIKTDSTLEEHIENRYHPEQLQRMLELGLVSLYLDGFNEILDASQQQRIAREINLLKNRYEGKGLRISLSTRSARSVNGLLNDAKIIELDPLNRKEHEDLRKAYLFKRILFDIADHPGSVVFNGAIIEGSTTEDQVCEMIGQFLTQHEDVLRSMLEDGNFQTPEQLNELCTVIERGSVFSDEMDFTDKLLDALLERERDEKQENIQMLELILHKIVRKMNKQDQENDSRIRKADLQQIIEDYVGTSGANAIIHFFNLLLEMPIMKRCEWDDAEAQGPGAETYEFVHEAYRYYFDQEM